MLLITLIIGVCLIFLSGLHWCAYKIDKMDGKYYKNSLMWSMACGLIGLYHIISLIGMAAK